MKLASIFSDGMILQRDTEVRIWGYEANSERVEAEFAGMIYDGAVKEDGRFKVVLPPQEAGGPYTLRLVETGKERFDWEIVTIHDVLVGDVWLISGQSNMELPVYRTFDLYEAEFQTVNEPRIRMFQVPQKVEFHEPLEETDGGNWMKVNPTDVRNFSAVGYFFAKHLHDACHVPVGLIQTAVGGAHVEAFLSEKGLRKAGEILKKETGACTCATKNDSCKYCYQELLEQDRDDSYVQDTIAQDMKLQEDWNAHLNRVDAGCQGKWYLEEAPAEFTSWKTVEVPGLWENTDLGEIRGSVWLRRSVEIPQDWIDKEVRMVLGTLIDGDETYVNGTLVGRTEYRYPPRRYVIPAGVLREGTNQITVRVIITGRPGGFITEKPYYLKCGDQTVDLCGQWKYCVGAVTEGLDDQTFFLWKPTGLYNAMIHPVRNYGIAGVLYYQGESNDALPWDYETLFRQMIADWRDLFKRQDLPFIYVQLANFEGEGSYRGGDNWAPIRDAQRKCLEIPYTAMESAIDIGEDNDLHPQNKKELGRRLALAARGLVYGESIEYMGPIIQKSALEGKELRLTFEHVGSGIKALNGRLSHFEVLDREGKSYETVPKIELGEVGIADTLVLDVSAIQHPVAVQYAWANAPGVIDFYNEEGFPASPFRTKL